MIDSKLTSHQFLLSVNGNARELPLSRNNSLGELLEVIRGIYNSESSCISSIRIDGEEISESTEKTLGLLPLSQLKSVEVFTAQPRELAEQTLRNMADFCAPLAERARQAGESFRADSHSFQASQGLASLVDGIDVFTEALLGARRILRVRSGELPKADVLEADLLSIMKDVVSYYEAGETAYVAELLTVHLRLNLDAWRQEGIPALIRARDS